MFVRGRCGVPLGRPLGRSWLRCLALTVLSTASGFVSLGPSPASAAFTRPFLRQITGTPAGPLEGPGGLAVDGLDRPWVGDGFAQNRLDGFDSAAAGNSFAKTLPIEAFTYPENLAIERSTGNFYITGGPEFNHKIEVFDHEGSLLERWKHEFGSPTHVAVDNSTNLLKDPSACTLAGCVLYVAHGGDPAEPFGDGQSFGIGRFISNQKPQSFGASAPYIGANQIIGTPPAPQGCEKERFNNLHAVGALAVDPEGNIYALDSECAHPEQGGTEPAVLEYRASGEFVRLFTGQETPGADGSHAFGGFGGVLMGVAIDPLSCLAGSCHLLVSVWDSERGGGAVDEFDLRSGHFLNQINEAAEGVHLQSAFDTAVDSGGDVYVADHQQHAVDVYGPGRFLPSVRLSEASKRERTSAVLDGEVNPESLVNPEESGLSDCHFEYVTEQAFTAEGFARHESVPCEPPAGAIPHDSSWHPVQAHVSPLSSGTTYYYRLLATTSGGLGGTSVSAPLVFTAPAAPTVEPGSTSATNVSSTSADLRAHIDPLGVDTTYRFQYVDETDFTASEYADAKQTPEVDVGSGGPTGNSEESVLQHLGGLSPATTYHFRVLAQSEIEGTLETTAGPDATFVTLPEAIPGLPDGRAYELLTPSNKGSASDMFGTELTNGQFENNDVGFASEDGNHFELDTAAAFGPFPGSTRSTYVFSREHGEWVLASLASPTLGPQALGGTVASEPADISLVAFDDAAGAAASEGGERNMSLVGPLGGPYTTLHVDAPYHENRGEVKAETTDIVGASRDLSHVVLEGTSHTLCPGAEGLGHGHVLCAWELSDTGECTASSPTFSEASSGCLELVQTNSAGSPVSTCGASLDFAGAVGAAHDAVSADGSRIFFTAPDPLARNDGPGCWRNEGKVEDTPQLYVRSEGAAVRVSKPTEKAVADPCGSPSSSECDLAEYVGASEDGSRVFFATKSWLTKDHPRRHDLELYEYDTHARALKRISAGEAGSPAVSAGADVWTVPAVSANGNAVYFTAFGSLAPGASPFERQETVVNLYRYDTSSGQTSYVGAVSAGWDKTHNVLQPGPEIVGALAPLADWYTTPDGRYLLFPGNGLQRYDAATGSLACVACMSDGTPDGGARFARSFRIGPTAAPVRAMSDNGAYVFFDTPTALLPQDSNGTLDVYEWHEGHIALISSGQDLAPSFFLGADSTGTNAFIGTHARLVVPQDADTAGDVYDARICTPADPCIKPPPAGTGRCEGDACQTPPPAPIDAPAISLSFSGAGNLAPAAAPTHSKPKRKRCPKGKVRRKGRCVKQSHKKRGERAGRAAVQDRGGSR
jgi:hypothetical protein